MEKTKKDAEYNPIYCDHKKPNGFSAYDLLSHSSGSGPKWRREFNLWVCLKCGEVKVSGKNLVDDKIQYFNEEFSIHYPDAVAAIVKNCNYMNKETDGYKPFETTSQSSVIKEQAERIEKLEAVPRTLFTGLLTLLANDNHDRTTHPRTESRF